MRSHYSLFFLRPLFLFLSLLLLSHVGLVSADPSNPQRFVLGFTNSIVVARMDPIVAPGGVAGHVHAIAGASNFRNVLNSPSEQASAVCSSTKITADKSSYWTPLMYFINPNGTYSAMSSTYRIYYMLDFNRGKLTSFPAGFRMIAGLANRRDPGAQQTFGLGIHTVNDMPSNGQYLPNGTVHPEAPDKIVLTVTMPSCGWANQTLDSDDHFSHMAYPIHPAVGGDHMWSLNSDRCPDTHPIRYPTIKFEIMYTLEPWQKEAWNSTGSNFILSNGDTTGLTYHADFVAGWQDGVLEVAIDQCGPGAPIVHDTLSRCAAFKGYLDENDGRNCRYEGEIPAEDVGFLGPLDKLPGCNPRWDWDGPTTKPECHTPPEEEPAFVAPNLQYNGYLFNQYPLAIPGVDGDHPETLVPMTGYGNTAITPRMSRWAMTYGNRPVPITSVLNSTQADVDAAAKASFIPGTINRLWSAEHHGVKYADEGYTPTVNPNPVDTAAAAASNAVSTRRTATYQCATGHAWSGFPCGPGATPSASASANAGVSASASASASSSVSPSANASMSASASASASPGPTAGASSSSTASSSASPSSSTSPSSSARPSSTLPPPQFVAEPPTVTESTSTSVEPELPAVTSETASPVESLASETASPSIQPSAGAGTAEGGSKTCQRRRGRSGPRRQRSVPGPKRLVRRRWAPVA